MDDVKEWRGQHSRVVDETSIVAATQVEWVGLWRRVGREPPARLPDGTVAVGVFLGQRPTAGYLIEIVSAVRSGEAFVVIYAERAPTGPALMVLTYPYLIRLFPDSKFAVKVEKRR